MEFKIITFLVLHFLPLQNIFAFCDEPLEVLIYLVWNFFFFHIASSLAVLTLYSELSFPEVISQERNFCTLYIMSSSAKIGEAYEISASS